MSVALGFSAERSVLVVDDTPENLYVISEVLRDHFKVRIAPSGERALQMALSEDPPDLILLDIMMPGIDGYDVLRRLQSDPKTAGIPVLFVSAKDQDYDEHAGGKAERAPALPRSSAATP